jgi:hypothetical protein
MRRLEFHASAASEDDLRRWQTRLTHPLRLALCGATGWFLAGVAFLYVYHAYLNYHSRFGKPVALVEGKAFTAKNVILLVDTSGSMRAHDEDNKHFPDTEPILQRQLERLQTSGISVGDRFGAQGFGFSVVGDASNGLHSLEAALQRNPNADTIYLFSDFDPTNVPYPPDFSDADGYARLREVLRQGHRRLYIGTVRKQPDRELIRIARESGGDLIESK